MRGFSSDVRAVLQESIADMIAGYMRPYQLRWLQDESRQKVALWPRQVGKTEVLAVGANLGALQTPGIDEIIVSASDAQAQEILRKCVRWLDVWDAALRKVAGVSIYKRPPASHQVVLINDSRIVSISPNPKTAAGYTGNVTWDEVAKTPHDRLMFEAMHPMITSGDYTIRLGSTPWGDRGIFYETWTKQDEHGDWSRHPLDILEAVKQGCPRDLEWLRRQYDWMTWQQDYLCKFISAVTSAFGYDLVQHATELSFPDLPARSDPMFDENVRLGVGVDIGRYQDNTAIVVVAEYPGGMYRVVFKDLMRNEPFAHQRRRLSNEILANNPNVMAIDATGIGNNLAEDLHTEYPSIVKAIPFTGSKKIEMVSNIMELLQSDRLLLIPDSDLLSDMTAIQRKVTDAGNLVYDAERTESGHADIFWALALAVLGLKGQPTWNMAFLGKDEETDEDMVLETEDDDDHGLRIVDQLALAKRRKKKKSRRGLDASMMPTASDLGAISITQEEIDDMDEDERREFFALFDR